MKRNDAARDECQRTAADSPSRHPAVFELLPQLAQSVGWACDPRSRNNRSLRMLGARCLIVPKQVLATPLLAMVSSRLGQSPELREDWFRGLRACCAAVHSEWLLVSPGTAAAPFVRRAARLFGKRCLELDLPSGDEPWEQWCVRVAAAASAEDRDAHGWGRSARGYLSPPLPNALDRRPACGGERGKVVGPPLADRALVALADRVVALHVRNGGHVKRLLRDRMSWAPRSAGAIRVVLGRGLVRPGLRDALLAEGAVGWALLARPSRTANMEDAAAVAHPGRVVRAGRQLMRLRDFRDAAEFVTHCTRRHVGPWPGQSQEDYWDDLILGKSGADHSPLATLSRMLQERTIRASTIGIRGGCPVVCFTEVPLPQLQRLRVFRAHRSRWDFQPYGICIRKTALRKHGGRPVIYGDNVAWAALNAAERPFYQKSASVTASGFVLDWTLEQEWRYPGAVGLDSFAGHDVRVFVPTMEQAFALAPHCPYRLIVVGRPQRIGSPPPGR